MPDSEGVPDGWVTIDELARETGLTVRTVRAHQARGLLPPPDVVARTGYYGPDHRARLELVKELQNEGTKLDAIKKLLDRAGGSTDQVLRFTRTVRAMFDGGGGAIVDREEIGRRFGTDDPATLARAVSLGLLRKVDEQHYEETSPRLARAGEDLARYGVPIDRALTALEQLRRHADGVARTYVELFLEAVWKPFDAAGRPADQWPLVQEALQSLAPVAGEALQAVFEIVLAERIELTLGRDLDRWLGEPARRRRTGRQAKT